MDIPKKHQMNPGSRSKADLDTGQEVTLLYYVEQVLKLKIPLLLQDPSGDSIS